MGLADTAGTSYDDYQKDTAGDAFHRYLNPERALADALGYRSVTGRATDFFGQLISGDPNSHGVIGETNRARGAFAELEAKHGKMRAQQIYSSLSPQEIKELESMGTRGEQVQRLEQRGRDIDQGKVSGDPSKPIKPKDPMEEYIAHLQAPLDKNDPHVRMVLNNVRASSTRDASDRGISGGLAVGNTEQAYANAYAGLDDQRQARLGQALQFKATNDLDAARFQAGLDAQDRASEQSAGQTRGALLGAAAGYFFGGGLGGATTGAQIGAGIGGAGANAGYQRRPDQYGFSSSSTGSRRPGSNGGSGLGGV